MPESAYSFCRTFEFLNSRNSFTSLLDEMLSHIAGALPPSADRESVLFKSKYILTELLTNAIKHSFTKNTLFKIDIENNVLKLVKTDNGSPLSLILHANNAYPHEEIVTADAIHVLYAQYQNLSCIKFFVKENMDEGALDINNIMEHFGLLIITKSSDEFYYHYDPKLALNRFEAIIKLF